MKHFINYKTLLLTFCIGLFGLQASAQSGPVYIVNNSSCNVYVDYVEAYDCNTSTVCYAYPRRNCVKPGDKIAISPCGGTSYEWAIGAISMADADCRPCGNLIEVQREVLCYSDFAAVQYPPCANCNGAFAEWISPNVIEIN